MIGAQRDAAIGDGQLDRRAGIIHIGERGAGGNIADGDAFQRAVRDIDIIDGRRDIQRDRCIFIARSILGEHLRRIDGGDHLNAQRHRIRGIGNHVAGIGIGVGGRRGDGQIEIIGIVFKRRNRQAGQLLRRQGDAAIGDGQLNRGAAIIRIGQRGAGGYIADGDAFKSAVGDADFIDRGGNFQRDRRIFIARGNLGDDLGRIDGGGDGDRQRHRSAGVSDHVAGIGIGVGRRRGDGQIEIIGIIFGGRHRQAVQLFRRQRDAAIGDGQLDRGAGAIGITDRGARRETGDRDAFQRAVRDIDFIDGGLNIQRDRRVFIARSILGGHLRRIDGGDHLHIQINRLAGVGNFAIGERGFRVGQRGIGGIGGGLRFAKFLIGGIGRGDGIGFGGLRIGGGCVGIGEGDFGLVERGFE